MTYRISQGGHYSGFRFHPFLHKEHSEYNVRFDRTCAYSINPEDQADTNKLFGFTFGFPSKSARFGWKSRGKGSDKVILLPYVHDSGIVHPSGRVEIRLEEWHILSIHRYGRSVLFCHFDNVIGEYRFKDEPPYWGYKLWPYFGGNQSAPHDMKIDMLEV